MLECLRKSLNINARLMKVSCLPLDVISVHNLNTDNSSAFSKAY